MRIFKSSRDFQIYMIDIVYFVEPISLHFWIYPYN